MGKGNLEAIAPYTVLANKPLSATNNSAARMSFLAFRNQLLVS
jgi:hypothetical protein